MGSQESHSTTPFQVCLRVGDKGGDPFHTTSAYQSKLLVAKILFHWSLFTEVIRGKQMSFKEHRGKREKSFADSFPEKPEHWDGVNWEEQCDIII